MDLHHINTCPPDLTALASLFQELLGLKDHIKTLKEFQLEIWPATVIREVLSDLQMISLSSNEVSDLV